MVSEIKRITDCYYNDYMNLLSNKNNKNISEDIIKFIKNFIDEHKDNLDIDKLNKI